jgi:hypothetical protein
LRPIQRAAKNDIISLVDGLMNTNLATKPRMMPIKNLAKDGPVGVLKRCCTTPSERIGLCTGMRRSLARFSGPASLVHAPSWADFTTTTAGFEFSVHTALDKLDEIAPSHESPQLG